VPFTCFLLLFVTICHPHAYFDYWSPLSKVTPESFFLPPRRNLNKDSILIQTRPRLLANSLMSGAGPSHRLFFFLAPSSNPGTPAQPSLTFLAGKDSYFFSPGFQKRRTQSRPFPFSSPLVLRPYPHVIFIATVGVVKPLFDPRRRVWMNAWPPTILSTSFDQGLVGRIAFINPSEIHIPVGECIFFT